ncbi:MAG: DUF2231 domain-containing protein [Ignavibacteriales bacterium]
MRTRASFKGHAIHQMLIPFPIGLLVGSFAFDLLGIIQGNLELRNVSLYIAVAGVVMGLVAAVPGFIDYVYSVPPDSTGAERATRHMMIMLVTVILFGIAAFLRYREETAWIIPLLLEAIGTFTITLGGWMGGTLVNRNFIGTDHRYAESGRWKEESFTSKPGQPLIVAKSDELKVNQMKLLRVDDKRIVLARTEDGYYAFSDSCSHRGGSLADGVLICGTVQCLWHGSQFDIKTGNVKSGPAKEKIPVYKITQKDGQVLLELSSSLPS